MELWRWCDDTTSSLMMVKPYRTDHDIGLGQINEYSSYAVFALLLRVMTLRPLSHHEWLFIKAGLKPHITYLV